MKWRFLSVSAILFCLFSCGDPPQTDQNDDAEDPGELVNDENYPSQNDENQPSHNDSNQTNQQTDCLIIADGSCPGTNPPGLFLTRDHLMIARDRALEADGEFSASYNVQSGRAESALDFEPDPFVKEDITDITFGWCGDEEGTLSDAVGRLEEESDVARTLAMEYALTGDEQYAQKAVSILTAWAEVHTPVNIYDFNPDFENAEIDGQTDGFCSDRPWNFALDAMWQTYGLINFSDAYVLLSTQDYAIDSSNREAIEDLLSELIDAVNSSFHAWTKWADHHPNAGSYERYRSDNHLSWSLAGLLAGAVATADIELAQYVLDGGEWEDGRANAYQNPSHVRDVIGRAIEGDDDGERGRIYEERIERDPPVGYAFFHLWALAIVAQIADVHFADDIWNYQSEAGAGLFDAYDRYADFVLGERESPNPDQDGDLGDNAWHYELALHHWDEERFRQVVDTADRSRFIVQSWGPISLLFGR